MERKAEVEIQEVQGFVAGGINGLKANKQVSFFVDCR
jgi:hypothetical protein